MTLIQMHHQYRNGHRDFISQKEINNADEHRRWMKELWESDPPPKNAIWMACTKNSKHFIMTSADDQL